MNKNSELSNGERLVCLETKVDIMNETLNSNREDIKSLIKLVNDSLPTYATKLEMKEHTIADETKLNNLRKANRLQSVLTNILVGFFSVVLTTLFMFWINNK